MLPVLGGCALPGGVSARGFNLGGSQIDGGIDSARPRQCGNRNRYRHPGKIRSCPPASGGQALREVVAP
jgi:hypothetical protein